MDYTAIALILVIAFALLILYYIFLVKAILQMLLCDTGPILPVFAFLALLPVPPTVVLGVMVMIIWNHHKGYCKLVRG